MKNLCRKCRFEKVFFYKTGGDKIPASNTHETPYILIATLTFPTTIITNLATNLITNSHQYHHPYCYLIYTQQHKKVVNSKTEAFSLTVNICVNSWSNLTTRRWNPQEKLIPNIEILTVKEKASIFGLNTFLSSGVTSSFDFATFKLFSLF